jgi:hypothetical protein
MVSTMTREQHGRYIGWVLREIDRLLAIDAQGGLASLDPEDRVALRAEWYDVVDRYLAIVAVHDAGRLPADLQAPLLEVTGRLGELTPVLERLRLRQPDPAILARLRLAAAS